MPQQQSKCSSLPLSDHSSEYEIESITFDSSCQLLRSVSERDLSARDCESITKLIAGKSLLCLAMIGNVLKSTPADVSKVISSLKKEQKTQGPGFETQSDACIRLSLNNLKKRLLSFGKYLSMFPGSFSLTDACAVMSSFVIEECLVEKLMGSKLLQVTEGNHYHFRDTVKKHFRKLREESGIDESFFWREYLKYLSEILERRSQEFQRNSNHVQKLQELEKQEIRLFLRTSIDCCREFPSLCLKVLHSIKVAIESRFLVLVFDKVDFVHLLQTTLSNIDLIVENRELDAHRADIVNLFAFFSLELTEQRPTQKDQDLVFEQAQIWLDRYTNEVTISLSIRDFYLKLSSHYSRSGKLQEELYCHVKMLKSVDQLNECDIKSCNYSQVSEAYYNLGEYRLSAYFQELYINHTDLSTVELTEALLKLHACQVGNLSEAERTAREIVSLYANLTCERQTHRHLEMYHNISAVFRLHKWRDEACKVEEKLLAAVRETDFVYRW